jgi:hypothetical protein
MRDLSTRRQGFPAKLTWCLKLHISGNGLSSPHLTLFGGRPEFSKEDGTNAE